jgi:hypothetical protein
MNNRPPTRSNRGIATNNPVQAFAQLILACVLVDIGRVDEAAVVGRAVCATASTLTSARVHTGWTGSGTALTSNHAVPEVSAFLADLQAVDHADQPRINGGASRPM